MGFIRKWHSMYLRDFIYASFQSHIVLYNRHKAISYYGTIDLDADRIFWGTPELLYPQVLLDAFEEQSHAPAIAIKLRNCLGRCRKIICQENIACSLLRIETCHFTEFFGIMLRTSIDQEADGAIGYQRLRMRYAKLSFLSTPELLSQIFVPL